MKCRFNDTKERNIDHQLDSELDSQFVSELSNKILVAGPNSYLLLDDERGIEFSVTLRHENGKPAFMGWMLSLKPFSAPVPSLEFFHSIDSIEANCRWLEGITQIHHKN